MVLVQEQQEASNAVAATVAAMPLLRQGVGLTLFWRFCPTRAATCLIEAVPAGSSNNCVCLPLESDFASELLGESASNDCYPEPQFGRNGKAKLEPSETQKEAHFCERRKATSGSSGGIF